MKKAIVIVGMGEMGSVFAKGFLKMGRPVVPVTRTMSMDAMANDLPEPEMVLIAVAENDLHPTLSKVPAAWQDRIALLQNELLPGDWEQYSYPEPTVISVWFEKKPGKEPIVLIPSPIWGPHAHTISGSLSMLDIANKVVADRTEMIRELVIKNMYIVTMNVAGLVVGGTVGELWEKHRDLALAIADDVQSIQERLTGMTFDQQQLIDGVVAAINGDLQHQCMGRSAPARLARAIEIADREKLQVPKLREIQKNRH